VPHARIYLRRDIKHLIANVRDRYMLKQKENNGSGYDENTSG
jgi:hypothetical protein